MGYVLSTTSKLQNQLEQENRELKVEFATLTSPDRLEAMSRRRLGLRPPGEGSGDCLAMKRSVQGNRLRLGIAKVFSWFFLLWRPDGHFSFKFCKGKGSNDSVKGSTSRSGSCFQKEVRSWIVRVSRWR